MPSHPSQKTTISMSDFWVDLLIVRKLKNCMFPQTKMLKMLEKFWSKQVVSSGFESVDSFFNVHVVVLEVKLYPEWKPICAMVKSRYIGDGHLTFNKNPYNGYINPYYWVDDHPLIYGNNGSLDPGTYANPSVFWPICSQTWCTPSFYTFQGSTG